MSADIVLESEAPASDAAFEACASMATDHYENFPVASLFLPAAKRPYVQAVYAFSRVADDMADEGSFSREERLKALDLWEAGLRKCFAGEASHPVFTALRETVTLNELPIEPFLDLLSAFRQDVVRARYDTFEDVLDYCRRSANPVGRLVLLIFGYRSPDLMKRSDSICTALQLANFWQDVSVDLRKNRLYIPLEDFNRCGYTEKDWCERRYDSRFVEVMNLQVERTERLFRDGAGLPALVDNDLSLELKLILHGGMTILSKIESLDFDVLHTRPSLHLYDKFKILVKALSGRGFTAPGQSGAGA